MRSRTPCFITAIALVTLLATPPTSAATVESATKASDETVASTIERTMRGIEFAKKPLPAWALDMAMRAYGTWKTYRNGQKVEEVQREVLAALKVIDDVRRQVEAGREMTDREVRLTRELLDAHDRRLADLAGRLDRLEPRIDGLEVAFAAHIANFKAWLWYNRVCKQSEYVWRPRLGKCVHVSVAGTRW